MKSRAPNPISLLNTGLLLLLIYLTLGNRQVGRGNATRLDSQRAVIEMEAGWQRKQVTRIIESTVERWQHLYGDNPQLRRREVSAADMKVPLAPSPVDSPGTAR